MLPSTFAPRSAWQVSEGSEPSAIAPGAQAMPGSTPRASRPRRLDTEAGSHSGALAVGLMGILAAKPPATERIIAMSRHAERQQLARLYDAMDIVDRAMDERRAIKVLLT